MSIAAIRISCPVFSAADDDVSESRGGAEVILSRYRCQVALFVVMLDLLPFGKINRVLADVGGEVRDPLEVATHQQTLEGGSNRRWISHHVGEQHPEHRVVECIHYVVFAANLTAESAVGAQKSVEGITEHFSRPARHVLDLRSRCELECLLRFRPR